jgi:tripartite-type tricarboxylate transporter receptor subunit TctC
MVPVLMVTVCPFVIEVEVELRLMSWPDVPTADDGGAAAVQARAWVEAVAG